ncbi:MAG: hypothetical protein HN936_18280, partial [Bacteroidetes bacterium]|nr:hypothetical protein [Bacteroidota bacterium]
LKVFNTQSKEITSIFETETGMIRDPEVSFDGKNIVFSFRQSISDDYHIYEITAEGTNLRQLTSGEGVSDIDPIYLPDGGIAFSSTREPKYCMCNRHIMANMFRMNSDGSHITQLGRSTLFEGHTALMNDGRLIYDRWEYIDRNFGDAQGLWTVNPDGTRHAIFYGNNTNSPGGVIDPRPIPGSNLVLCIFGSCHDRPWGALTLIDRSKGVDGEEAVVKIWPENARSHIGKGNWDEFKQLTVRYEDPFPIDNKNFLVSKSNHIIKGGLDPAEEKMAIYHIQLDGGENLLFEDPSASCFDPMPLAPRFKPPVIPFKRNFTNGPGQFYVSDVYEGTHMQGVQRGSVKYLRVIESPPKRTWTPASWGGQGQQAPGVNWHSFENKKILGTVPVEPDGSAFFEVPSGVYLYFQLLDTDKKMVQSMRSGVIAQAGEINGCIGCHEDRLSAPVNVNKMPMAIRKAPHKMNGWNGASQTFNYATEVQPVFDKHCLSCHDFGSENPSGLILAGDKNPFFNASYIDLHVKKIVACIGGGPADIQDAYSWGSHPSKLIQEIEKGHHDVKLNKSEMQVLYTWIDLNGVYYPEYESAYPNHPAGRSPITHEELKELGRLCNIDFYTIKDFNRKSGPQISFERPDLSPCLDGTSSDEDYKTAISIISKGYQRLKETPRCDMPGFVPSPLHQKVLAKYDRLAEEAEVCRLEIVNSESQNQ